MRDREDMAPEGTDDELLSQEQEVLRGRRAQRLLRDPLIVEAFEELDRAFYRAFQDTQPTDTSTLVHIRLLIKCLAEFKEFFEVVIQTGQITEANVKFGEKEELDLESLERQRLNR